MEPNLNPEIKQIKSLKPRKERQIGIYNNTIISRSLLLNIVNVGSNIKETLEKKISNLIEGKCIIEGYVKSDSTRIITYSSGLIQSDNIKFDIVLECLICSPVEGMHINCIVKNVTKAGLRAESFEEPSPIIIFISRDHHNLSTYFSNIKVDENIKVKVIGQRFELNDKYISIIAELIESREEKLKKKKQPKLIITE